MDDQHLIKIAEQYLKNHKIQYVLPGQIGERENNRVEVVFLVPLALEPNCVIDPPDVRLWVNVHSGEVTFIDQM